jgi:hypothetical protein
MTQPTNAAPRTITVHVHPSMWTEILSWLGRKHGLARAPADNEVLVWRWPIITVQAVPMIRPPIWGVT